MPLPRPETTIVINPAHRRADREVKLESAKLTGLRAQFGAHGMPGQPTPEEAQDFETADGELRRKIEAQEAVLAVCIA